MPRARSARRVSRRRSRRKDRARRARRSRRRARSWCRFRPTWGRAGTACRARRPWSADFYTLRAKVRDELGVSSPQVQPLRGLIDLDDLQLAGQRAAKREQIAIPPIGLARLELRAEKGLDGLRVRHVLARERGERLELLPPAPAGRFGDCRIDVI